MKENAWEQIESWHGLYMLQRLDRKRNNPTLARTREYQIRKFQVDALLLQAINIVIQKLVDATKPPFPEKREGYKRKTIKVKEDIKIILEPEFFYTQCQEKSCFFASWLSIGHAKRRIVPYLNAEEALSELNYKPETVWKFIQACEEGIEYLRRLKEQ